jgi:16S rRNA (cytosine967-C5)-methyltransferase
VSDSASSDTPSRDTPERFRTLLEQAGELARLLMKSPQAPRALTSEFLHGRKRFTAADRAEISAAAFHALRCWRPAAFLLTGETGDVSPRIDATHAKAVCAAAIRLSLAVPDAYPLPVELSGARTPEVLARGAAIVLDSSHPSWRSEASFSPAALACLAALPPVAASLPDWIISELRDVHAGEDALARLGVVLRTPAPLTLRVNLARISRTALIERLRAADVSAAAHPLLPAAVVVEERVTLTDSALYAQGLFEVQDAGSQLIGCGCAVSPGDAVFDACAGGGGKSMQLLDMMEDRGHLLAADIERNKLRGLRQRASRIAASSIETLALTPFGEAQEASATLPPQRSFDCVLVDAPCSGFGTVRRNPALRWRLQRKTVARLAERQLAILSRNAAYVRPGGILVYATCSLLPQENDRIISDFLASRQDFIPDPLQPAFRDCGFELPGLAPGAGSLTVQPDILDSDGYFLARMRRR